MFGAFKGDERLIQANSLPIRFSFLPISGVTRKPVFELMMSPILCCLIAVGRACRADAWSAQKSQAQGVVIGFVGTVLVVGEHCHAVSSALIGQIEPLMRRHFELPFVVVAAFDLANVP